MRYLDHEAGHDRVFALLSHPIEVETLIQTGAERQVSLRKKKARKGVPRAEPFVKPQQLCAVLGLRRLIQELASFAGGAASAPAGWPAATTAGGPLLGRGCRTAP